MRATLSSMGLPMPAAGTPLDQMLNSGAVRVRPDRPPADAIPCKFMRIMSPWHATCCVSGCISVGHYDSALGAAEGCCHVQDTYNLINGWMARFETVGDQVAAFGAGANPDAPPAQLAAPALALQWLREGTPLPAGSHDSERLRDCLHLPVPTASGSMTKLGLNRQAHYNSASAMQLSWQHFNIAWPLLPSSHHLQPCLQDLQASMNKVQHRWQTATSAD